MKDAPIKRTSILFLQAIIVLIGIGTLAFLLWEPNLEGVNAHATTLADIYFDDPFLAYVYLGSIAFFVALYQAFTLLRYIGQNKVFSMDSVRTLRTIKYCGIILVTFVGGAAAFLFVVERGKSDDIAGGVAMCIFATLVSAIITTAAAVFEKLLHSAVMMKQENDFTI